MKYIKIYGPILLVAFIAILIYNKSTVVRKSLGGPA